MELDTGYIIYSGDFLHGIRNGKGIEYSFHGNRIYEGEFLDGKRNGRGKEYYDEYPTRFKFEGIYSYGKLLQKINYNE